MRELFEKWLYDNTNLKEGTINSYGSAINSVTEFIKENKIIDKDIYRINEINELKQVINIINSSELYKKKNDETHKRWSNAIDKYEKYMEGKSNNKSSIIKKIKETYEKLKDEKKLLDIKELEEGYRKFYDRFNPEKLSMLEGEELAETIFNISNKDSLVYWLEFKNDDEFKTSTKSYGSISGGSSYKYILYKKSSEDKWITGSPHNSIILTKDQAIDTAEKIRNELVEGAKIIGKLSPDSGVEEYRILQNKLENVLSDNNMCSLGWVHKYYHMIYPDKIDTFHNTRWQKHALISCNIKPEKDKLYVMAGQLMQVVKEIGIQTSYVMISMIELFGEPLNYYRINTTSISGDKNCWDEMRSNSYVSIGWSEVGDLRKYDNQDIKEVKNNISYVLESKYKYESPVIGRISNQIKVFYKNIEVGDIVVAVREDIVLGIGQVEGKYEYLEDKDFPHIIRVNWINLRENRLPNSKEGYGTTVYQYRDIDNILYINQLSEVKYVDMVSSDRNDSECASCSNCESKNQILYGPPGTGKTYNVISRALEIIDKEKYKSLIENEENRDEVVLEFNKLLEEGQIAFCTFHQSYGYEEFVEGLRSDEEGKGFVVQPGIFKLICEKASAKAQEWLPKYDFDENKINFYKMALGNKLDNDESIYNYCIDNNCVALGWGENIDFSKCKADCDVKEMYSGVSGGALSAVKCFVTSVKKDDIVIIGDGMKKARAIGRVIGDYEFNEDTPIGYNHFRKVEWLYKDGNLDKTDILKSKSLSQGSIYKFKTEDLNLSRIRELISHKSEQSENVKNYVLIIDEINRGNISKIFGELITLIEEDKRLGEKNELKVTLPYSNDKFGVPSNVYILGTMNTADRSIALLDTALRRRFTFKEYMPDVSKISVDVDGINVGRFLDVINKRVEYLFDRDHTIGHAYFMKDNLTFEDLVLIMKNKIIPLLQEYFYGDWEKVELILGGAGINNDYFINKKKVNVSGLFKTNIIDNYQEQYIYSIVDNPTKEAFLNVYEGITE